MTLSWRDIKSMLCAACVCSSSPEEADATGAVSLLQPLADINAFIDSRDAGTSTREQANNAADGWGSLGQEISKMVSNVGAAGNPVAGLPSAAMGAALTPVARDVGNHMGDVIDVRKRGVDAFMQRDYSQISKLATEADAVSAANAHWEIDYGGPFEALGGLLNGVKLGAESKAVSALESIGKRVINALAEWERSSGEEGTENCGETNCEDGDEPEQVAANEKGLWRMAGENLPGECNISINMADWRGSLAPYFRFWAQDSQCQTTNENSGDSDTLVVKTVCVPSGSSNVRIISYTAVGRVDDELFIVKSNMRTVTPSYDSGYQNEQNYQIVRCGH